MKKFCCSKHAFYLWLSGAATTPALVHFIRLFYQWPVMIGGSEVTMSTSWIIGVVGLVLALFFGWMGCCNKCEKV